MKYALVCIGLVWLCCVSWLQTVPRSEFFFLWSVYTIAFLCYAWMVFNKSSLSLKYGLTLAVVARLVSFFFDPLLSDDYFRFIWDGMLSNAGLHPMAYTPVFLIQHPELFQANETLYQVLNSQSYYSVYPPVAQWIFAISFHINGDVFANHIIFYKSILCFADGIILFLLYKLLRIKNLNENHIFIYALNPLILIEFVGNLHMDGLMIAGLLGAVFLNEKKLTTWSSLAMALSILTKLTTLILIPFMPKRRYWKSMILFSFLTLLCTGIVFISFFGTHTGWLTSIGLWFQTFEFNAGIYYLFRGLGYLLVGYNCIAWIGPALGVMILVCMLWIWWKYKTSNTWDWPAAMVYVMTSFLLLSTTIHPWYIGILLALSVISQHLYPMIWTYLIFLSYSHYQGGFMQENYFLISVEYILLFAFIIWEWRFRKSRTT